MTGEVSSSPFTMVGSPDALACEGDACLVPGLSSDESPIALDIEPESEDEAAAASARAVNSALDGGASL